MVVPNSANANEYTLITPTLSSNTPTLYTVNGATRNITPGNGDTHTLTLSSTWAPLATTAGQPHTLTTVSSTIVSNGIEYLTEIGASNRTLQPSTWRSKATRLSDSVVLYDVSWLRRGGGDPPYAADPSPPAGGATDINERWWERFGVGGVTPSTMQFHHNPTMGGSGDRPAGGDPGVLAKMYTGRPYCFEARAQTASLPALLEGGCAPLDFGGDPDNFAYSDHGYGTGDTAEDQPAWWWRMRMWRKIQPNWHGNPRLTQVHSGSFIPFGWDKASYAAPSLLAQFAENWDLVAKTFVLCYAMDLASGVIVPLVNNFPQGNLIVAGDPGYKAVHSLMTHRTVNSWSALDGIPAQGDTTLPYPALVSSGYGALIYVMANGFTFALASKVLPCNESTDEDTRLDSMDACQIQAWHREFLNTTNSPLANEGEIAYVVHKSRNKRPPGWLLRTSFVYTGEVGNVVNDLRQLYLSGQLDIKPAIGEIHPALLASLAPTTDGATGTKVTGVFDAGARNPSTSLIDLGAFGRVNGVPGTEFVSMVIPLSHLDRKELAVQIVAPFGTFGDTMEVVVEGRLDPLAPWETLATQTVTSTHVVKVPVVPHLQVRMLQYASRQAALTAQVLA